MFVHTTEAASLLKISTRRLRQLLQQKRVKGAYKSGKFWLIPLYEGMPVVIKAKRGQAGTWKIGKRLKKVTININSKAIQQNSKKSPQEREPIIAIREKRNRQYVHQLEIPMPCRIVYNPDKPLDCGAKVWIEILNFDLKEIASHSVFNFNGSQSILEIS